MPVSALNAVGDGTVYGAKSFVDGTLDRMKMVGSAASAVGDAVQRIAHAGYVGEKRVCHENTPKWHEEFHDQQHHGYQHSNAQELSVSNVSSSVTSQAQVTAVCQLSCCPPVVILLTCSAWIGANNRRRHPQGS